MDFNIGDEIEIVVMNGEPKYSGKRGIITRICTGPYHDLCLSGTWGGLNVYPLEDTIRIINKADNKN